MQAMSSNQPKNPSFQMKLEGVKCGEMVFINGLKQLGVKDPNQEFKNLQQAVHTLTKGYGDTIQLSPVSDIITSKYLNVSLKSKDKVLGPYSVPINVKNLTANPADKENPFRSAVLNLVIKIAKLADESGTGLISENNKFARLYNKLTGIAEFRASMNLKNN